MLPALPPRDTKVHPIEDRHNPHSQSTATIAACIIPLCITVVLIFFLLYQWIMQRNPIARGPAPRASSTFNGLTPEAVSSIPPPLGIVRRCPTRTIPKFLATMLYRREMSCRTALFCNEEFKQGTRLRSLPCGHIFNHKCIDPWLLSRSVTCPLWCVNRELLPLCCRAYSQ